MFGSPLGPAGSGGLGDKEPAVDDQLNPSGFVPFSKRDRRGSGVGSRRPPTGSPNHPWRSCSASRRKTTLGSLISLGQCGLKAEARGHLRNMPIVLRVCLAARALNKTPRGSVLGCRAGLHFAGLPDWSPLGHKESGAPHPSCWSNKLNNSIRSTSPSLCVFCFPRKPQLPQLFSTVAKSFLLRVILCSCLFFLAGPEQTLSALARWVVGFRHGYKTRGSRQKFPSYCPIR
jgi:hypothetical protein